MNWNVLKTNQEYQKALKRTMEIFNADLDSAEDRELDLLLVLVKDYEDKNISLPNLDPIEVIKLKMDEKGLKAKDLIPIIGTKGHVSSVLSGRRELTLPMAQRLKNYFKLPADVFLSHNSAVKIKRVIKKATPKKTVRIGAKIPAKIKVSH